MIADNYSKKVLGVVGSPRRGGNTETIIDKILEGAKEEGAEVEKIILTDLEIKPCKGCDSCRTTGKCIINDDMGMILNKMEQSATWVLGTPIYWWGPTAQFKAFIDRWHGGHLKINFRDRDIVLVIPLEAKDKKVASCTVEMLTNTIKWLKANLYATIIAPGVYAKGEIIKYPRILSSAYEIGKNIGKDRQS